MITEIVRDIARETHWFWTTTNELKERRAQIAADLEALFRSGAIPQSPHNILDVGSGSGAGTFALRKLYPTTKISAIDDGSSHQYSIYTLRQPPVFIAKFNPESVERFARPQNSKKFDLIIASRFPICYPASLTWKETCLTGANRIVALAELLSPGAVLAFGYWQNSKLISMDMRVLLTSFHLPQLFTHCQRYDLRDQWLVLKNNNQEFRETVRSNPTALLTEAAQKIAFPYPCGGIDPEVWDS